MRKLLVGTLVLPLLPVLVSGADWPQWRGPERTGICTETGLLKEWPKDGPKLLWDSKKVNGGASVGTGFSSMSIAQGKIFTMGDRKGEGDVFCLNAKTGKELWKAKIGPGGGDGPRCSPTVDGDRLYALTRQGNLACLKVADGAVVWAKELKKDFGGKMMSGWDYSESPLVDGDRLVCTPGGKDAVVVALNKMTGEPIWKCQAPTDSGAGYASIVIANVGGRRQYITLLGPQLGLIGVDAATGKFLWNYKKIGNGTANIPTAIVKDDYVFTSTGYGTGAALLQLVPKSDGIDVKEVYFLGGNRLQNHHGGMVMLGDYIYGGHGHNQGLPFCLEWKTGKLVWGPERGPGGGSAAVLYADGNLYFRYESGTMALVEANPKEYKLKSSFKVPIDGNGWPHPVIHEGKLYLRGKDQVLCYDIKQ
jgi:outer membrane protein assembly factor BamB